MKSVRSANIHQLNWKQEMFKFLKQYRCTPHVTTPYKLLFGREPKTMLPTVPSRTMDLHIDEKIRVNDSEAKYKMKCYADARNCADYRDIKVGDTVVMNRDEYKGKLQPKYERPGIVTAKKGPMITVNNDVSRNVSRFKKFSPEVRRELSKRSDMDEDNEIVIPNPPKESIHSGTPDAKPSTLPALSSLTNLRPRSANEETSRKIQRLCNEVKFCECV